MIDWRTRQNRDGGWAYHKGCSWTEPTVFVLLAQTVAGIDSRSFEAGLNYLRSMQRPDGGFRPQPGVDESTWVTAAAALLPEGAIGAERLTRAITWLKGQTGRESSWSVRLRQMISGDKEKHPAGWPWFPGAAAWVIPTSLSLLAFERALLRGRGSDRMIAGRIDSAREFLFSRMCTDGGWNMGSSQVLGRDLDSYPETTGIALTALHHAAPSAQLERAKRAARLQFSACATAEGIAWLRMGLAAHGENRAPEVEPVIRTTLDAALSVIAAAPRNPMLT